jgi:hypothetical protein
MNPLKVEDQYRTNALSLQPGGYTVTVIHQTGKSFIYDKVKKPGAYIKSINDQNKEHGPIVEVLLNGNSVWTKGCGRDLWEI